MSSGTDEAMAAASTPGSARDRIERPRSASARLTRAQSAAASGEVVGREQHAFATEAGIGVARLDEASEEEPGHEQDDHRERHLDAHQAWRSRLRPPDVNAGAERLLRIDAGQLHRRRGADQQRRMPTPSAIANASPGASMLV